MTNVKLEDLRVGQRFLFEYSDSKFIAEVIELIEGTFVKVKNVQSINWFDYVGFIYSREDMAHQNWEYLPGQDKPTKEE